MLKKYLILFMLLPALWKKMRQLIRLYLIINCGLLFAQNQTIMSNDTLLNELPRGRAMWIWNTANMVNNMINDVDNAREELYNFCQSPHGNPDHRINVLFLSCKDALFNNQDNLRNFLADAYDNGLIVEYLDGDPSWATYNQQTGITRINKVLEFNASASSESEKFKGVQFDVEPYLLKASRGYNPPYWDTDMDTVWALYVSYVDSCQRIIDSTQTDLYFGIAIPRWYENHVGNAELYRLQSVVDYTAIMDYNEKSSVIIRDAENEINNASALNKRVWIGVETKDVYPEPETVTFYEEGVLYMESELKNVISAYGDYQVFSGIAIHAYYYYKSLSSATAIENHNSPDYSIILYQNFENPVRAGTKIQFKLPVIMHVEIVILNVLGQKITTLVNGIGYQGINDVFWNASEYPPGIYFYRIKTSEYIQTKKLLLVR